MAPRRDERVFLVRMWRERETQEARDWRGSVHDVGTGRRLYVTAPGEVSDFISIALTNDTPALKEPLDER